jgi:soluble lytic murein transglycosylase-like protein
MNMSLFRNFNIGRAAALTFTLFVLAFSANAQGAITAKSKPAATTTTAPAAAQTPAAKPTDDLRKSLNELLALTDQDVQRLEKENGQIKDLYKDGLVARVEMERSDKSLVDARAKSEDIRKQIAELDKPLPDSLAADVLALAQSTETWSTGNAKIDGLVRYYGDKYGVDSYLIYCLMSQESGFSSRALSNKGAQGLMQLMPGTAARYGVTNSYDVAQSIMGGTRYLKDLLQMFHGRVDLALAGYNAGEGAVIKYNYSIPPYAETQNYVRLISMRYTRGTKPKKLTKPAS